MRKTLYDYCRELGDTALLEEWDSEKNELTPQQVTYGSKKKLWWVCGSGHSYQASATSRTGERTGCPYCTGRLPIPGENDLATLFPGLVREWDGEKNQPLTPSGVLPGSHRSVWWLCPEGHSWRASIKSRVDGCGCPVCTNRRIAPGENDLATANPRLAAEWDAEKNAPLTPRDVTPYSNRRVWWRCPLGHEYQSLISARNTSGSGCPYCTGRRVLPGFNDLASQQPKVAAEWAQDLNGSLTPEMVTTGSQKKVWWRCSEGHVWRTVVFTRARGKFTGCPVCAGKVKQKKQRKYTYAAPPGARITHKEEKRT